MADCTNRRLMHRHTSPWFRKDDLYISDNQAFMYKRCEFIGIMSDWHLTTVLSYVTAPMTDTISLKLQDYTHHLRTGPSSWGLVPTTCWRWLVVNAIQNLFTEFELSGPSIFVFQAQTCWNDRQTNNMRIPLYTLYTVMLSNVLSVIQYKKLSYRERPRDAVC